MKLPEEDTHQNGDSLLSKKKYDFLEKDSNLAVDTFGGRVHVEWDPQSAVTPLADIEQLTLEKKIFQ